MILIRSKNGGLYAGIESYQEEKIGGATFFRFECVSKAGKVRKCQIAADQIAELVEYEKDQEPHLGL